MFFSKNKSLLTVVIFIILSLGLAVQPTMSVNAATATQKVVTVDQIPHPTSSISFILENFIEVKKGDNLWNLSKQVYWNGWNFGNLVQENPFLQEPGRLYYDKKTNWFYVMIHPGEKLVTYQPTEPEMISIGTPDTTKVDTAGVAPDPNKSTFTDSSMPLRVIIVLALLALLLLYLIARWITRRMNESKADPVTSGDPQVKGGVNEAGAVQRAMNIAEANGINPLRVTNIQKGRFYGRARVFYADKPNGEMRRFNGEDGYRGIILRTDGTEENVYFLQGCGNDVRQGNFFTGVRFVADDTQPDTFRTYNEEHRVSIEVTSTEEQKASNDAQSTPFNSRKEVFETSKQIIEKGLEAYFEVSVDGMKFKLDTLNKVTEGRQISKKGVQAGGEKSQA